MSKSGVNTIFSYFNKTPKAKKNDTSCQNGNHMLSSNNNNDSTDDREKVKVQPGDLVWAKLEGYPWWPSLVYEHPGRKSHVKSDGKLLLVHVQFFDDPPSRGWVKEKCIKPYQGSVAPECQRGGRYCRQGALAADSAMASSRENRLKLVVAIVESDAEEEEEEEDDEVSALMDGLDADIFDAEFDSEKENDINNTETIVTEDVQVNGEDDKAKISTRSSCRPKKKRRRTLIESGGEEDSEDDFKPAEDSSDDGDEEGTVVSDESSSSVIEDPETPVKVKKRKRPPPAVTPKSAQKSTSASTTPKSAPQGTPERCPKTPGTEKPPSQAFTPSVSDRTKSKLDVFSASQSVAPPTEQGRSFPHQSLDFLQLDKIRDSERRPLSDAQYNARTLCVPESFLAKQTPAMRQWWAMKAKHFDTVLFFKMGKFYELFHMDAVISVTELGIVYMKGEHAHAGFPEISYGRYSQTLVQKGYRVARIEQTETPDMMSERCKAMGRACTKFDKVVKREVCSVQTKATRRQSFIDGASVDGGGSGSYLLAIRDKSDIAVGSGNMYGVCFVDTTIGKFWMGQFEDDRHASRLRTLFSSYPPAQVLYERGRLSQKTQSLFTTHLSAALKDSLRPGAEFWDASKTLNFLAEADYFRKREKDGGGVAADAEFQWPETLAKMMENGDSMARTASEGHHLALSALGAVVWYLKESFIEDELLSMRRFDEFLPLDLLTARETLASESAAGKQDGFPAAGQRMVLDAVTLTNLEIVENGTTGGQQGTLLETLDRCSTPFGKRLFRQWLCSPLCDPAAINDRLDAVDDLESVPEVVSEVNDLLRKMPDLEKLISRIHTLGSATRARSHPDSRAIFFEDLVYSKRKIEDFLSALAGLKLAMDIVAKFKSSTNQFKSRLLRRCVTLATEGSTDNEASFPDLAEQLRFFDNAFDQEKARSAGVITPSKGVDVEFDTAIRDVKTAKRELDDYLDSQKDALGCRTLSYFGTGKNRYQLEVPDSATKRVPSNYDAASQRKGFRRYRTAAIDCIFARLVQAEDKRDAALKDIARRIFYAFDQNSSAWQDTVQCLSVLDSLLSLAAFTQADAGATCRPRFVLPAECEAGQPMLDIREGRHPCISHTFSGSDFIPNDTLIGVQDDSEETAANGRAQLVLVTGANMGGKSTLMRQVGIIVIMAQMGCYVPAQSCHLTPVDRVFTRLGASDRIMSGESTFFVELSETSAILQHATRHSLVLLDELGRGTATYDGTAIAYAVVNELSRNVHCRTLFSTHYHSLVGDFSANENVRLGHMACMVENENDEDPSQEMITFLYKFVGGACPKSYGFNAARLADIPLEVIRLAHTKARELENATKQCRLFRSLHKLKDATKIRKLLAAM